MARQRLIAISLALVIVAFVAGTAFGAVFFKASVSHTSSRLTLYELAFTQQGACSPAVYAAPWGVVLNGNSTVIEPAGQIIPTSGYVAQPSFKNYSVIEFAVTQGTYEYSIEPSGMAQSGGNVTMSNSDMTVIVAGPTISCTTTINVTRSATIEP